jgi:hypothetical protein
MSLIKIEDEVAGINPWVIAKLMLRSITEEGATDRNGIASHVREQLEPLTVTDDDLCDAAEHLIKLMGGRTVA